MGTKPPLKVDTPYIVAITVVCTILVMVLFVNRFAQYETRFVNWFSRMTSQPRWFTIWLLIVALWIAVRHELLEQHLLGPDADLISLTILWSVIPFMVENLLKSSSAQQMEVLREQNDTLTKLVLALHSELDKSKERDGATYGLLIKIADAIEERGEPA